MCNSQKSSKRSCSKIAILLYVHEEGRGGHDHTFFGVVSNCGDIRVPLKNSRRLASGQTWNNQMDTIHGDHMDIPYILVVDIIRKLQKTWWNSLGRFLPRVSKNDPDDNRNRTILQCNWSPWLVSYSEWSMM